MNNGIISYDNHWACIIPKEYRIGIQADVHIHITY